ncbi:LemA family protein [Candidatus Pacearchaeota archaeon]|nr:LemA family protein [Candidatus Pacearchaeota archaeon]
MSIWFWILIIAGGLIVIMFITYYNRFAVLRNRIENSGSQIDVQLKRRADLVPNLVEAVKGYMKHEKKMVEYVTDARKVLIGAKSLPDKVKAGDNLAAALKTIFAIAENYPNLKANENFIHLQQELSTIEDKIAYARQFYNDSVLDYDNLRSIIPGKWFAGMFGAKEEAYLKIPEAERAVVKVKFE